MIERELPFISRNYRVLACVTLAATAFNLTFRLGQEFVTEWDESLYAISAWEALHTHSWLGTTFLGQLDYYNTKPPLLVWFIAFCFKVFGPGLWSLRIVSVVSAWLTVFIMQRWTRRYFGDSAGLLTALVLATTFGFVQVHSGRSAATDAPFTLLIVLTAVTLSAARQTPAMTIWLGPLLALAFMLRGMGVLMPLVLTVVMLAWMARYTVLPRRELVMATSLFLIPIAVWSWARYELDGWQFLSHLFLYDFVKRSINPIEQHPGGVLYYLNILQKHHYEWLLAAGATLLLYPPRQTSQPRDEATQHARRVAIVWAATSFAIPTLMQTKVPWYLNPFYPVFALAIGLILSPPLFHSTTSAGSRRIATVAVCMLMFGLAEAKLLWYSLDKRDLSASPQALLLRERERIRGHRLYQQGSNRADYFVATAIVGVVPQAVTSDEDFNLQSAEGDYLLTNRACGGTNVQRIAMSARFNLCRRR